MATQTAPERGGYASNPAELPSGTLVQLFFGGVDRFRDEVAFRHKVAGAWRSITYGEVEVEVRRLALALRALGIQRGERVAILSENRPEWAIADYASLCAGAVDVPVYATLPAAQIRYLLENSGARLAFVSTAEQLAKVLEIRGELPALETVVTFDPSSREERGVLPLSRVLELGDEEVSAGRGEGFRELALHARPDEVATILYTSGTTGRPKGVMLTHDNIFSNTEACSRVLPLGAADIALSLLPLSHIFERMVDYLLFAQGVAIAFAESIEAVPANLVEIRPTIVASVPRLYEKIHARVMAAGGMRRRLIDWAVGVGDRWAGYSLEGREPPLATRLQYRVADRLVFRKLRERTGGRLRFFISGGAPLSPDIARFFYSAGVVILEGYGLTETSPVTNVNTPDALRLGTVGPPVPGTEIRIAEDGEILVRGPQVMKGYFGDPDATAEALDADGWFHTGDIGTLDPDGFLRVTDRKKEIIVTAGGKNIAPAPIEQRVKMNRFVAEAVVVGDRRPYTVLLIVPDFEALGAWARGAGVNAASASELVRDERVQRRVRAEVFEALAGFARYETPHRMALLSRPFTIESGELTPSQKVKRRVVEERYARTIDAVYDAEVDVIPAVPHDFAGES